MYIACMTRIFALFTIFLCAAGLQALAPAAIAQDTISVYVNTTKPGAFAFAITQSGPAKGVEPCSTPCTLNLPKNDTYAIVMMYRKFPPELIGVDPNNFDSRTEKWFREFELPIGWDNPKYIRQETERCDREIAIYNPGQNADAKPCFRMPAKVPIIAHQSGYCRMNFDVGEDGRPFNIEPAECSEWYYALHALHAVHNWRYLPEFQDGKPVIREGLRTKVAFVLNDKLGNAVPGRVLLDNEKADWIAASQNWYKKEAE